MFIFDLSLFKKFQKKINHWFEERNISEAIRSGTEEERMGKLKPLSKDLHELLD